MHLLGSRPTVDVLEHFAQVLNQLAHFNVVAKFPSVVLMRFGTVGTRLPEL
jgi:hypothetical protein